MKLFVKIVDGFKESLGYILTTEQITTAEF